jgi:ABC-type bacteriocin/lantibiotic exporter with double-glycine peptidase domain
MVFPWTSFVPLLLAREAAQPMESPLPGCGPGAVYAMLRLLGQQVTIEQVETAFESAGLPTRIRLQHSVADLANVLRRFGVPAAIVESKGGNLQLPRLPAILHLEPRCRPCIPDDPGHFVVLHSVREDNVRIVDVTLTSGGYAQSPDKLLKR